MRRFLAALVVALAAAGALNFGPAATPASAQVAVSVSLFYQQLAPHGRWFRHPRWGWAWFPVGVAADWRPYSRGHWVWTDEYGWYWVSDEPFGWATYHYGRWAYDEEYGWVWIPGGTWGPAWVAFRYSDDYIGWAPLPPETIEASYGWDPAFTELDASYYVPRWVFVPRRQFLSHRVYAYAAASSRNRDFIGHSRNVTRYERGRHGIFNRSIEPKRLEAALGRRIVAARINAVNDPRRVGPDRRDRTVNVFRRDVRVDRAAAPPAFARARPQDRTRARIHRDAVAPSDRRESRGTAQPPAARAPDARPPSQPRPPASSQIRPRTPQPEPRLGRERRVAPSDQAPGAGPRQAPRFTQPAPKSLPGRPPSLAQPRHAAPPSPPRVEKRAAPPRYFGRPQQPPRVAPGAPPQRRAQPPALKAPPQFRAQPHAAPKQGPPPKPGSAKSGPGPKQDDKGKGR